jgi:hypothetical protein
MLIDVLEFVQARTQLTREVALREINYAWRELYNADDLPNSVFELTITPVDASAIISLPYYVGTLRGVKQNVMGRERVTLLTPRPYYQDQTYFQSPFTWRILGVSPIKQSVLNSTTVTLTFDQPVTAQVVVTLSGPDDRGENAREQITFGIGDITKESTKRFADFLQISKDIYTTNNLRVLNAIDSEIAVVPNTAYESKYTITQITDQCNEACNWCRCFDILYKRVCPVLFFDEDPLYGMENVLMTKTLEWITMPKDGQLNLASAYGEKARNLLIASNNDERSIEHRMDIGDSLFATKYSGHL